MPPKKVLQILKKLEKKNPKVLSLEELEQGDNQQGEMWTVSQGMRPVERVAIEDQILGWATDILDEILLAREARIFKSYSKGDKNFQEIAISERITPQQAGQIYRNAEKKIRESHKF